MFTKQDFAKGFDRFSKFPDVTDCDVIFFWNAVDLARKLEAFREYYNDHRVHRALAGLTPARRAGALCPASAALDHYGWAQHCQGLFEPPIAA